MTPRILVVDDEPQMTLAMDRVLRRRGWEVDTTGDGAEALSLLSRRDYAVVISDLRMPGMDGRELVDRVRVLRPSVSVIVVTAHGTVESAVSCVRAGALDYLQKPFSPEQLLRAVDDVLPTRPQDAVSTHLVAEDPATLAAIEMALRAAQTDATVLLEAESGAGKEVFARLIHRESPRAGGPFVAVNCAAMPRDLLEAELFGHCKGAFTGAHRERKGHFQIADGGTLLLDEVGEMSADLQSRLLRVLQDRQVQPVGSELQVPVDVRVIAATNRNLREEVIDGRFREDLYYRLRVLPLRIPPLRSRPADIEPLAREFAREYGGQEVEVTPRAISQLREHCWPGNVRELQNVIQRATVLSSGARIDGCHLDLEPALRSMETPLPRSLEDAEREAIRQALLETRGNRGEAASALGISPRTLRHKLKRYRDAGAPIFEAAR